MKFYNRKGVLYVSINGIRKSTKLPYSNNNIKKFKSYYEDNEFFNKFNIQKDVMTINELCDEVLNEKENEIKSTSFRTYLSLFGSLIYPYFKNKYPHEISPLDIFNWYSKFTDSSTLNVCNAVLKPAFEKAILRGYIKTTPFIIKKPKLISNYKINPFTFDEANQIIDKAPSKIKNLLGLAFYSGMRIGEILGLKWSKVNFNDYLITIDLQRTSGIEQSPKTYSSIREIDMIPQIERFLLEQKKLTYDYEYVFVKDDEKPYNSSSAFYIIWVKILKELNFEKRSLYQTRHTFASNMLSNGENQLWVSEMLGHKDFTITYAKYSKYLKKSGSRRTTFLDNLDTNKVQSS